MTSPPVSIPRLRTARLLLREYRITDFDAYAESAADPLHRQYMGAGVLNRRDAWKHFSAGVGTWILQGAGWWAVEEGETGRPVGMVGAFYRPGMPDLEVGWWFYKQFWGRGFATEAAAVAIRYGFENHRVDRIIAHVDERNVPSRRVAEKLGMRDDGEADLFGTKTRRWVINRSDAGIG